MISVHEKHHLDRIRACRDAGMPDALAKRVVCGAVDEGSEIVGYAVQKLSLSSKLFVLAGPALIGKTVAAAFVFERIVRPIDDEAPPDEPQTQPTRAKWLSAWKLAMLRPHDSQHADLCEAYLACPVLVIDGISQSSPTKMAWLSILLASRFDDGLVTICTTSMSPDSFTDAMGLGVARRVGSSFRVFSIASHSARETMAPVFAATQRKGMTIDEMAMSVDILARVTSIAGRFGSEDPCYTAGSRVYSEIIEAASVRLGPRFAEAHGRLIESVPENSKREQREAAPSDAFVDEGAPVIFGSFGRFGPASGQKPDDLPF